MKVAQHAKQQTRRSKDALYAHAAMAASLIKAKQQAEATLAWDRLRERPLYYRLNADHSVSPIMGRLGEPNGRDAVLAWARDFERFDNRQLARDDIEGCLVSTVFLGLDHAFGSGPPVLFETMAFSAAGEMRNLLGREHEVHEELEQRRYCTYDEAMKGHAEVVAHVRATVAKLNAIKGQGDA